ncbi:serine hydrolase domain-containing protein [Nonomuraea sp. NPDC049709]|uniref:serine hydrolase domain-containing protein n=1 Tax=Nonomuraea sp. NPDC049709 TaxID=3154736 RepID=UPI0034281AB3
MEEARRMTPETYGDDRLAAKLNEVLDPARHPVAAVATVTSSGMTVAGRGAPMEADFEIGSITKGITGLLYVDALARGEISRDTLLGEVLPIGDVPAARISLAALSTHRSGLPRLPAAMHPLRRTIALWRHGTNPYGEDLEQLLAQARGAKVGKPAPRYSNFGFELLGHAIARAAGTTYADLVRDRIAGPLKLGGLYVPANPERLRPTALTGRSKRGRPREPWTGEALGPAGGARAAIRDMALLTGALLNGTAPGVAALDPVAPFQGRVHIGAAWLVLTVGSGFTLHNGGTGGFRSWLGLHRASGTGVVVLSATAASVDRPGFNLLTELSGGPKKARPTR